MKKGAFGIQKKGQYEMNQKVGVWEFYNLNGELEQKYNYSTGELLFNEDKSLLFVSQKVVKEGIVSALFPEQSPILIGGSSLFVRHIMANLKYPIEARDKNIQGKVLVSAIINSEGKLTDAKVVKGLGYGCDEEAISIIKSLNSDWIAGVDDNHKTDVLVVFSISFKIG